MSKHLRASKREVYSTFAHTFECQMYVTARGTMNLLLPSESGPRIVARLVPLRYDELVDPGFRRLLAAFNNITATAC